MCYKKLLNSYKNCPHWGPHTCNLEIGPLATKAKICSATVVWLNVSFPKCYDTTGSTSDHGTAPLQGKGQGAGQGLPGWDWEGILPTQKLLQTNLASPENFVQICSPV